MPSSRNSYSALLCPLASIDLLLPSRRDCLSTTVLNDLDNMKIRNQVHNLAETISILDVYDPSKDIIN
ncbi:hypothetical protein GJ496_003764 [Pomphorhynchus laevis]|nr:hypothetical protein GJ496_003764 [Pomphorhynchus laevis]